MSSQESKPKVIFVGAFKDAAADGTIGGQAFACLSLVESQLSREVEWLLIDSTQRSQPPPGLMVRIYYAAARILKSFWWLLTRRVHATLVFTRYEFSSFLEKGLVAIFASILGRKSVVSIRSEVRSFGHDRWTVGLRKWIVWFCDTIICQSNEAAEELVARLHCPREKIKVIPNWIDAAAFRVEGRIVSRGRLRFLFMGWLEKYKGAHHLLEAAAELSQAGFDYSIDICGGGSEAEALREQAQATELGDRVEFHGWVSGAEKRRMLERCDVLVLPSYSEGMPNSVLEAMAAGMAVIATPVGGTPTLIASEQQGYLVGVGEVEPLVGAMQNLINDRQKVYEMGKENVKMVNANHHVDSVWPVVAEALGIANPCDTDEGEA